MFVNQKYERKLLNKHASQIHTIVGCSYFRTRFSEVSKISPSKIINQSSSTSLILSFLMRSIILINNNFESYTFFIRVCKTIYYIYLSYNADFSEKVSLKRLNENIQHKFETK